jgi:hypothetical protein
LPVAPIRIDDRETQRFFMLALLLSARALAEPAFLDDGFLIAGTGEFALGVGAPTVDVDPATGTWVMYFESPMATVPSDCVNGYQIGRATSTDGLSWTVDPVPVVTPDAADSTSNRHCSVAQPAVVYDGSTWHLFWSQAGAKAKSSSSTNTAKGIAYATSVDGLEFTVLADPAIPAGTAPMGLASATIVGDTLYALYSDYPDLDAATLPLDGSTTFSVVDAVMDNAAQTWSTTWLLGPSLLCVDGDTPSFEAFVGGDSGAGRSLGLARSADGTTWSFDADSPLDGGDLAYAGLKHWDVLGDNEGAWWLWYSEDDPSTGLKAIGGARTADAAGTPQERWCDGYVPAEPEGDTGTVDTGDTGLGDTSVVDTGTVDTGDTGLGDTSVVDTGLGEDTGDTGLGDTSVVDTGLGEDTGTDPGHPGGWGCGWGCTEHRSAPWSFASLIAIGGLAARRRRA